MEMNTSNRPSVSTIRVIGIYACLGTGTIISLCLIQVAFLSSHPKCCGLVIGEVKRRYCNFVRFTVADMGKFQRFLFEIKD